jgi:hypothetical protein
VTYHTCDASKSEAPLLQLSHDGISCKRLWLRPRRHSSQLRACRTFARRCIALNVGANNNSRARVNQITYAKIHSSAIRYKMTREHPCSPGGLESVRRRSLQRRALFGCVPLRARSKWRRAAPPFRRAFVPCNYRTCKHAPPAARVCPNPPNA